MASLLHNLKRNWWIYILAIIPILINPWAAEAFESAKASGLQILAVFGMVTLFFWIGLNPSTSPTDPLRISKLHRWVWICIALIGVSYIISSIFATHQNIAWHGNYDRNQGTLTWLSYLVVFLMVTYFLRRSNQLNTLFNVLLITSIPVCLYGLAQFLGYDPLVDRSITGSRSTSFFGNPIFLAAYINLLVPITLLRLFLVFQSGANKKVYPQVFLLGLLAMLMLLMLLSGSRGPALGLVCGLLFIGILLSKTGIFKVPGLLRKARAENYSQFGLWGVSVALVVMLQAQNQVMPYIEDIPLLNRMVNFDLKSGTSAVRTQIWEASWDLINKEEAIGIPGDGLAPLDPYHSIRQWIGYGPDNQLNAFASVYPPAVYHSEGIWVDRAHNHLLDLVITRGYIGLVLDYLLLALILLVAFRNLGLTTMGSHERKLVVLLAVGLVIGGLMALLITGNELTWLPLGLSIGFLSGAVAFLVLQKRLVSNQQVYISVVTIVLTGAILGDFVSNQFAFATTTTSLYNWIFVAILLTLPKLFSQQTEVDSARVNKKRGYSRFVFLSLGILGIPFALWYTISRIEHQQVLMGLKEGDNFYSTKRYEDASRSHLRAVELSPSKDYLHRMLLFDYSRLARQHHDRQTVDSLWNLALLHANQAIALNSYHPENHYRKGRLLRYMRQGGYVTEGENATDYLRNATTLAPTKAEYYNQLARELIQQGNCTEAREILRASMQLDSTYAAAWMLKGDCLAMDGQWQRAISTYENGLALILPTDGPTAFLYNNRPGRLSMFQQANRIDQLKDMLNHSIEDRRRKLNDPNLAIEARRVQVSLARAKLLLGEVYYLEDSLDMALKYYLQSHALDGRMYLNTKRLAEVGLETGNLELAEEHFQIMAKKYPHDLFARLGLASVYAKRGALEMAIAQYRAVIGQASQNYNGLKGLALIYLHKGDFTNALKYARRALEQAPEKDKPDWFRMIDTLSKKDMLTSN